MQTTTTPTTPIEPSRTHTLDGLMAYSHRELEAMYRAARTPTALPSGKLAGRMLAWKHARGPIAAWLRRYAKSPGFVWEGKTFAGGGGYNRVRLGGLIGHQHIFPFEARIEPSLFDGRPTIAIDYGRPANPWWMRRIFDEIRELEPNLYLGLDLWKTPERAISLVWFALDGR